MTRLEGGKGRGVRDREGGVPQVRFQSLISKAKRVPVTRIGFLKR